MKVENWPIEKLTPYARNPRKNDHAVLKVAASIKEYGWRQPIVVDKDGVVVAGHTRLLAAMHLKQKTVPVHIADELNPIQVKAYRLADNRVAQEAEWDDELLALEIEELQALGLSDLDSLGFEEEELAGLHVPELEETEGLTDPDEVPEPPEEPTTKPGDLWLLGRHRLLCGDSTKAEDVERLLANEAVALIAADPPYFEKVSAEWDNDFEGYEGFLDFLDGVFDVWEDRMIDRGTAAWWCAPDFAWHIEGLLRKHFAVFNHVVWYKGQSLGTIASVEEMRRWRPRSERLLLCEKQHSPDALLASFNAKTSHIAARSAYSSIIDRLMEWQKAAGLTNKQIDKVLGTNGMAGHYFGRSQWALPTREAWDKMRPLFLSRGVEIGEFDAQRQEFDAQRREFDAQRREFDAQKADGLTDVWEGSAPHGEDRHGHPTPKPISFMVKILSAHSRPADIVADPFLGSGTTLIAAEQLGRKCYGMEISPQYCDVIVKRWEDFTGKKAVLADG